LTDAIPEPGPQWRRKTWEELQSDQRRRRRQELNPLGPLLLAAFGASLWTAMRVLFGGPRHRQPPVPPSHAMLELLLGFVVLFLVLYISRAIFRVRFDHTRLTICSQCYDIRVHTGADKCACGGNLDNADRWTRQVPPWTAGW
jgi:hypothetical protein